MSKIRIPKTVNRKTVTEYETWTLKKGKEGEEIAMAFTESKFDEHYPESSNNSEYYVHNRNWITRGQLDNPSWRKAVNFIV